MSWYWWVALAVVAYLGFRYWQKRNAAPTSATGGPSIYLANRTPGPGLHMVGYEDSAARQIGNEQ